MGAITANSRSSRSAGVSWDPLYYQVNFSYRRTDKPMLRNLHWDITKWPCTNRTKQSWPSYLPQGQTLPEVENAQFDVGKGQFFVQLFLFCTYLHLQKTYIWFFVTYSCDNRKTSTPKTIYILNRHDKGNVSGPFSLGLGSGCRKGFLAGSGSFDCRNTSTINCSVAFLNVNFLTPLEVRGQESNQIWQREVHGKHEARDSAKRVKSAGRRDQGRSYNNPAMPGTSASIAYMEKVQSPME